MTLETPFMRRLLVALCAVPGLRAWRVNAGRVVMVDPKTGGRRAFQGAPAGAADIAGIAGPNGRHFEVETKAAKGRVRVAQDRWSAMVRAHGGVYLRVAYDEGLTMDGNVALAVGRLVGEITGGSGRLIQSTADDDDTEF